MFEIRITAETLPELLDKAAQLNALGMMVKPSAALEVPLPEPRVAEVEKPRRGRKPKVPEEAMHAKQTEDAAPTEDVPEHMQDGPATIEEAREELERPTTPEAPTETESAPPAESEQGTSDAATDALEDGADEADSDSSDSFPPDFAAFIEKVEGATKWNQVPEAMREFYNTETFRDMSPDQQNRVRANTWEICIERRDSGDLKDLPALGANMTAFRLWLESSESADTIKATKAVLENSDQWAAASDPMRQAIDRATEARLRELES